MLLWQIEETMQSSYVWQNACIRTLEKLSTFFSPFKNALKLYIWSALLRLTAPAIQFAILPVSNGNTQFCVPFACQKSASRRRYHFQTHTHTTHSTCFPSISFYYVILLRAFLQQQTDERAKGRRQKNIVEIRQTLALGFEFGEQNDHFSKMVNLSQNVELLFYFRSPKVSLLLLFSHSAARTRLEVEKERRARERRGECCVSRRIWFGQQPAQICETWLRYCTAFRTMYRRQIETTRTCTSTTIIIMLLICRYEWK